MFCKHNWKILSETVTKSKFECAIDSMKSSFDGKINIPRQLCCADRKFIQVVCCTECGKLKRFVEDI